MKNKIQSYVGMRLGGRRLIDALTTHLSPTNHPLKHGVGKYIFSFLLVLAMSIGQMWAAEETLTWAFSGINTACTDPSGITKSSTSATSTIQSSMAATFSNVKTKSDASSSGYSSKLQATAGTYLGDKNNKQLLADQYVGASFTIPDGYVFKLKSISFPYCAISTGINARLTISDGETDVTPSDGSASSGGKATISYSDATMAKELSGDVTVKIWFWMPGSTSTGKYAGLGDLAITGDLVASGGDPIPVTGITIAPSSATIKVGKTVTLGATITPSNATDKAVTWAVTSGNTYASVNESGVVTGLAAGEATITATAHDGSGVTQTATVTVEECPTSGTIFSMDITASEGTAYTGNNTFPTLIDATYVGGAAYSGSKSGTNRTSTIDANGEYPFSANSELAIKVVMDCDLAEGDIINITTSSTRQIKIQKVVGADLYKTADKTFTIPSGSSLIGENVFYLMRDNSESTLKSFTVIRPLYRTITLKYADGETPDGSIDVIDGTAATKPADPTWEHHRFDGWYNGASPYDWTATVSGDLTLTAHWTQLYTVTYAAGDGTATGDAPTQVDKAEGETFTVAANTFAVSGKDFDKWNDGSADYAPGDTYTVGAANIVLTAQWKAASAKYTVIFKDGETTLDTKLFEVGSNPSDADIDKTKALFTFAAWQKDDVDIALDAAFWATVAADAEVTLKARWAKAYASNADFEAYIIANKDEKDDAGKAEAYVKSLNYALSTKTNTTFDANDETNNGAYAGLKIKNSGTTLSWNVVADKVVELKAGVMVANGSLSINGGAATTIDGGSTSSGDNFKMHYFYSAAEALYVFTTSNNSAEVIKAITMRDPYQVSFNDNGGCDPIAAQNGTPSVTLPTPVNPTANFTGWYDAATEGNKIGDAGDTYTPTADIELFAQWETVSTDARLASISFSSDAGTLEPTFDPEVTVYTYTMPYGTAAVPTITGATSVNANAQEPEIASQAAAWNETAVIRGVAQSGDKKTYNVTMKIEPKDGISIIKVATTGGTNKTVTGLYAGEGDVNLSGSKKMDGGKYIGFTLDGTTLQAGDRINVHTTTASSSGGSHIIFYDNMTDKNELYDTEEIGGVGNNIFTINAAMVGKATAYVYRSDADAVHKWNGYIDYIEVIRAMNPVLTAIAINGRAGEIDPLDDKHFNVTIPYEADLAALTVVPTIVRNAAHATTPEAVISNEGAWILGDNTYRVMDKDGDYTDYTITLDRDVLKHTVSFNTHGGSAVDPVEVAHGAYLLAAPADPTKEDYLFQGWAETEDGTIVDVTSFTITADKEFHAVWAADGAIKLLDGATVNHTNFITGVTADETVEFQGNTVNYAKFSGTVSGVNGVKDLTRVIAYNATTNKTKIQISAHNNSTSGRSILVKGLVEGASAATDLATIALGNKEDKVSEWIEFNNAANRTIYIMVSSSAGDVYFTQVKVIESGETPMKQVGEAGYSLNLNKGRFFGPASTDLAFEGLNARLSGDYTALNSGYAKLNATSMSFTVASDMLLTVTANNNKTYYVTKDAAGTDNETAKTGASEFNLTAGTWFITAGTAEVQLTNIAFALPKCEQPTVVDMESIGLCEGDAFIALTVSASVSDEGTLHYAWFKEAGATDEAVGTDAASFTPEADGEYYVIVTNQKTGYSDNSETSNTVSVEHFAAAVITTAPADVAKEVGQEATLSVAATGKNCTYAWFTCDDALGTNPVAIVPAETEASLTVTVAAGEQYYMVVVSSDCGAPVSAVAKVAEWRELTPANVTGSVTWDWTSAAWNGITGDIAFANTGVEELMANVNAKVPCVDGFRSDMLYGTGQYVWRSGNKFFQGTKIRFITTVPGKLVVRYRNTSGNTNTRTIKITNNGEVLPADGTNTTNSFKNTNPVVVKAGEVIIEGIASEENGLTRIEKIIYDADLDPTQAEEATLGGYERDVTEGRYGTICLPKDGIMVGAAIFELAYYSESDNKIFMDQVMSGEMVAGRPYIFLPNEGVSTLGVYYTDDEAVAAGNYRGLYGYYDGTDNAMQLDPGDGHYILYNNQFREVTVSHVWIDQNRAYFKIGVAGGIPTNVVAPLPGRRRMSIGAAAPQVTTGMDELNAGEAPVKVLINGELFILRGDKMFDATGRLIK